MRKILVSVTAAATIWCGGALAQSTATTRFDLPAQPLADALRAFGTQTNLNVMFDPPLVAGRKSPAIRADMTPRQALEVLLAGTGIKHEFVNDNTVVLVAGESKDKTDPRAGVQVANMMRLADSSAGNAQDRLRIAQATTVVEESTAARAEEEDARGVPEILVKGARTFNTDIRRTEDDVQPYVVFEARDIEHSMATTLNEFLHNYLTMNTSTSNTGQQMQTATVIGDRSMITLRGLKEEETLILVNGRRMPGFAYGSSAPGQADINSIPISSVARIEVLPSTAGGIYGGGATGGVINIILRDDYRGMQFEYAYQNPFDTDAANKRIGVNGGYSFMGGRTRLTFSYSQTGNNALTVGDRDFAAAGRELTMRNNPGSILNAATPPMGSTSNIRSLTGAPLVLKQGMVSLNSPITHIPVGYAGVHTDGGAALLANAGKYNLEFPDGTIGKDRRMLMPSDRRAATLGLRHQLSDRVELYLDGNYMETNSNYPFSRFPTSAITLAANAPNNPFTTAVRVMFPGSDFKYGDDQLHESTSTRLVAGTMIHLPNRWRLLGEVMWGESTRDSQLSSRTTLTTISTALANGTLDIMRDTRFYPLDYSPWYFTPIPNEYFLEPYASQNHNFSLRAAGPTIDLGAGPVMVSGLIERHKVTLEEFMRAFSLAALDQVRYNYSPERNSTTESFAAEITTPVVSARNARPGVRGLDLQFSYRFDRSTMTTTEDASQASIGLDSPDDPLPPINFMESSVNAHQYTLGLRYTPFESMSLRVSYSVGVLPPNVNQLTPSIIENYPLLSALLDPRRNNEPITSLPQYSGLGFPGLKPEDSDSWSMGLIYRPTWLPGLRASVDYTRIEKTNELALMTSMQWLIDMEAQGYYLDRVIRSPLTDEDIANGYTVGRIETIYAGHINYARTFNESYDADLSYSWNTARGNFMARVRGAWHPHQIIQAQPTTDPIEYSGYSSLLKWRANAALSWERGPWTASWNVQYFNHHLPYLPTTAQSTRDLTVLNQGSEFIPAQMYHDVSFKYQFGYTGALRGLLNDTELFFGVANVFNKYPPIIAANAAAFTANGYSGIGNPMLRRYSITVRKSFN